MPHRMIGATACAIALALASQASAATLHGTVAGTPVKSGGRVSVPILLGSARATVSVPRHDGIRTRHGAIAPDQLRIGDRVTATARRASVLHVGRRGHVKSFGALARARTAAASRVQQADRETAKLNANPLTLLDPATPAKSEADLRGQLTAVREGINSLIAEMRSDAGGLDAAAAEIEAVTAASASLVGGLKQAAAAERQAADRLDAATARLDTAIDGVGEPSSPSVGLNEVGTVSEVLSALLELLRGP